MKSFTLPIKEIENAKKALLLFVLFSIIVNNPILAQGNCPGGLVEIVIPVAVHYDNTFNDCTDTQCLIDAAINNIASLNLDFAAENSDKNKYNQLNSIDPLAHPLSALGDGTCISFCLATQNHPEGEGLTNGQPAITIGRYTFNENGPGALAWEGYVNIFVQEDAPAIGRANTLSEANGDGVRIRADVWGGPEFICESVGNLNSSNKYNLGRTLTHELGHYFDLQHTYSPDLGDCSDHDTISISSRIILTEQGTLPAGTLKIKDTPATDKAFSDGCPIIASPLPSRCGGIPTQFTNFMDTSDDDCLVMFTKDQSRVINNWANTLEFKPNTTVCGNTLLNEIADCQSEEEDLPPVTFEFDAGQTSNEGGSMTENNLINGGNLTISQSSNCGALKAELTGVDVYSEIEIDIIELADEVFDIVIEGDDLDPEDFIGATFGATGYIANVCGLINTYLVTVIDEFTLEYELVGSLNYSDFIQVYSPIATTLELPIHVSADLVAVQSFCNPDDNEARAEARITGSLAGTSINVGGEVVQNGPLLGTNYINETEIVTVDIQPGINTFEIQFSGELKVKSSVIAPSPLIACASNAVAISGNSLTVGLFTGVNGGPLPEGMTIDGLLTGANYVNPTEPMCLNVTPPNILIENDNCGLGLGSATVTNIVDTLTYEWSDGQTGSSADMLNAGDYYCYVSAPSGCSRAFYVKVNDPLQPNITLPTSVQLEDGDSLTLQATDNADPNLTYLWSTGEVSSSITVSDEDVYSVSITTQEGCIYDAATEVKLLTTCFDPCADCASFYFDESWDSTSVNIIGNAYLSDTSMVLHNASTGQHGACWYIADKQILSQGFTSTFDFRLSDGGGLQGGADGFAFVIQNSQPNALGSTGSGIGYRGISNGVAVEFDTYGNGSTGDPDGNHVSVQGSSNGVISSDHWSSLGWATIPTDLIDGEIHQFRLHYNTDSLLVFFDTLATPIIAVGNSVYDLIENVNDGVWLGFTGSTGLGYHKTEIYNWSFSTLCSASCNDGIQNGNETSVDCGGDCSGCQCIVIDEEYDIQCHPDGSYDVSFSFTPKSDGSNYMVYDLNDYFGELDTIYFIDDGSISELTYGPYMYGRPHSISLTNLSDSTNCFTEIKGDATCAFNESCNVSATFSDQCVSDSLVISGTIIGGTGPYSIYSDIYSTVIFPDEGDTFEFIIPSCSAQSIDFTITDFTMCQYTKNIVVDSSVGESSCLESVALYPNPAKSILNVSFSELCDDSNIEIYDSLGRLMQSGILTESGVSYDVSLFPKGIYFLYLNNEKDRYVEKFIKI